MTALTRWVLSHKLLVVPCWIILAIVGLASAQSATRALSTQFTVPGGEGITTSAAIVRHFGSGGTTAPILPVITLPKGVTIHSPGVKAHLAAAFDRIAATIPGSRLASYATTGDQAFVSRDGRTTFGLVYTPTGFSISAPTASVTRVEAALRGVTIDGARFNVTGLDALSTGTGNGGDNGVLAETMIAAIGSLVVLLFVFGSALAILPLLMALVAIPTTFLLVWGLASVTYVSFIIEFIIALVGLGVVIDYSLLVVMRWREERSHGLPNELAVVKAMETAGRSVIYSGCTVAIGLAALTVLPLPFLRSMGYGGILIPLVTVTVVLTLLPIVLATVGPFLDWPRHKRSGQVSRVWTAWANQVVRHPWIGAAIGLVILGTLLSAGSTISLGAARADSLAKSGQAHTGLVALERSGIGSGVLMPFEILVQSASPAQVANRIASIPGIRGAIAPISRQRNNLAVVDAFPIADEERLRFARDLHDLLGHSLSLIALKSELAGKLAAVAPERAAAEMRDVEQATRSSLQEVREAVAGYRQPSLENELQNARRLLAAAGIECRCEGELPELPTSQEAVIAWTVQEGVTNVIRHSRTQRCVIRMTRDANGVTIELIDDGGGVVGPATVGSGLAGVAERVASVTGSCESGALPAGGFRIAVTLAGNTAEAHAPLPRDTGAEALRPV